MNAFKQIKTRLPDRQYAQSNNLRGDPGEHLACGNRWTPTDKSIQCDACRTIGHNAFDYVLLAQAIWPMKYMKVSKRLCVQISSAWTYRKNIEKTVKMAQVYVDESSIGVNQMQAELNVELAAVLGHSEDLE